MLKLLQDQDKHINELTKDSNENNTRKITTSEGTTEPIMIKSGIHQYYNGTD